MRGLHLVNATKTSPKGFSASKCDVRNWIFSNLGNFLGIFWEFFGNFLGIFGGFFGEFSVISLGILWKYGRN